LASVNADNPAILQFSINDEQLGQRFTAEFDVCQWRQFYELWESGDTTTAEICIVNRNEDRNGNDFALDDFLFVEIEEIQFDSTWVIIKDVTIDAQISTLPDCGVSNGQLSIDLSEVDGQLYALDGGPFQEESFFDNVRAGEHSISIIENLSDLNTCSYDTTLFVGQNPCPVFVPNAFTSRSEDSNIFLITPHPEFIGMYTSLNIIDRWGTQVFYSEDHETIAAGWDGSVASGAQPRSGVYAYILEVQYSDGTRQYIAGDVTMF